MIGSVLIPTVAVAQCNIETLNRFNIALADDQAQVPAVRKWLNDPFSGYPALLSKICNIMNTHRLKGKTTSLMLINHENIGLHNFKDGSPITNEDQIDPNKLKQAIFEAWKTKNSWLLPKLPPNPTFGDILQ